VKMQQQRQRQQQEMTPRCAWTTRAITVWVASHRFLCVVWCGCCSRQEDSDEEALIQAASAAFDNTFKWDSALRADSAAAPLLLPKPKTKPVYVLLCG